MVTIFFGMPLISLVITHQEFFGLATQKTLEVTFV